MKQFRCNASEPAGDKVLQGGPHKTGNREELRRAAYGQKKEEVQEMEVIMN